MARHQTFELAVSPDLREIAIGDGDAALRHWDVLGRVLRQRNVVVDVGANVIEPMLRWMQLSLKPDAGHPVNFLVVVTAQEQGGRRRDRCSERDRGDAWRDSGWPDGRRLRCAPPACSPTGRNGINLVSYFRALAK